MKLKDIKVGDYVAARVKRYKHDSTRTERCRVKAIEGRYITLFVPVWGEERRVYFTVIGSTWADHQADLARKVAAAEAERARQNTAWETQRAAERERFEENILPAFKGLPAPEHYPEGRCADLAEYITEMMLDGGSTTVQFREDSLAAIAARIRELGDVIAQSALTAQDLPQAGWGVTDEQIAEQAERIGKLNEAGLAQPERTIIEIPLSDLGLLVPDGDA